MGMSYMGQGWGQGDTLGTVPVVWDGDSVGLEFSFRIRVNKKRQLQQNILMDQVLVIRKAKSRMAARFLS